jgi:L-ascorbate metabolism protein UlaG (beta-lactamase superfamily)
MVEVHFLWHSFFKFTKKGKTILVDPITNFKSPSKEFACILDSKIKEKDLKNITMILISHEHFDHFQKELVEKLAIENDACVVAHPHILQELEGTVPKALLHPITIGEKISLRDITVTGIPAHHPQAFYPLGFLIDLHGTKIYHAGDTDLLDDMAKIDTDIAILPIGGGETMDLVDAVRAVKTMKPKVAIPMHYNTFEMIKQDPRDFKQKIDKSILSTEVVLLNPGKKYKFTK